MAEPDPVRLLLDEREVRYVADQLFVLTDRKAWDAVRTHTGAPMPPDRVTALEACDVENHGAAACCKRRLV